MSILVPPRSFDENTPEMMDRPDANPAILEDDLRNLRVINRLFGGLAALRTGVMHLARKKPPNGKLSILDLATGSGDQPVSLAKKLREEGRDALITAVDRNAMMLRAAEKFASGIGGIHFEQHDILSLPYADRSFDIVTCSLAIHHFSHHNGVKLLREMDRLSRIGFVVNDLSRSNVGAAAAWFYTRLSTLNPMTRYDSVVSVLRAFTKEELLAMAVEAGTTPISVFTVPLFRLVAVREK